MTCGNCLSNGKHAATCPTPKCRHCGWRAVGKSRGICGACHMDRAIRALYPVKVNTQPEDAWHAHPDSRSGEQMKNPQESTRAYPGTEGKILVLFGRASRRENLFHADDKVMA